MNADENQAALTERIIGALFEVSNTLGSGFLEKVYERALLRESQDSRLSRCVESILAISLSRMPLLSN